MNEASPFTISELHEGTKLTARQRRNGAVEIFFDSPSRSVVKGLILIVSLIIWWLLWLFCVVTAIVMVVALVRGQYADTTGQVIGIIFVLAWLAGWGYGGMVLLRSLYRMFKGRELLILHPDYLRYRSRSDEPPAWRFWTGGVRIPRSTIGGVRIAGSSITLTAGSQRVIIGEGLESRDAQWVTALIRRWLS